MKALTQKPYRFDNIAELMERLGQPKPLHPLLAMMDYSHLKVSPADAGTAFVINFYKISFRQQFQGQVKYGPGYYDFTEGGLAFLGPNQRVTLSGEENRYEGRSLYFHPDLIRHYPLGKAISKYGFFSYAVSEALFLSDQEKTIVAGLFDGIARELATNIDAFSQDVLVSQIELLLNYSNRFYNRQFLTRKAVYNERIAELDAYLIARLEPRATTLTGVPTVKELADYLNVSPRYLADMLKSLTGQSTQQYIHNGLIEKAKDRLSTSSLTVAEIAYELGFEHPQSFHKLFKQKMQISPLAFRQSFA